MSTTIYTQTHYALDDLKWNGHCIKGMNKKLVHDYVTICLLQFGHRKYNARLLVQAISLFRISHFITMLNFYTINLLGDPPKQLKNF